MRPEILANWSRLSPLLDEALDTDPAARDAWLAALGPGDADLRPLLAELLAREAGDGPALAALPGYDLPGEEPAATHAPGDTVAGYRLQRVLGHGGMGTVWLAEPLAGTPLPVALKLPRMEGAVADVRERFERERAILAVLNHPRIARLHEAGVTPGGQPYLAIEYVEGGTIVEHCGRAACGLRERVGLFLQVLEAVRYAHANLVIHRDLKPTNILVTSTGDAKLLDFGIAKLVDRDAGRTSQSGLTQRAGYAMTPDYASPEQVAGLPLTTASDVYSLGVVLFELLAGARPYRLRRGSRAELEEAILAADAARPSALATAEVAAQAREPLARWRRRLRGDLDTIVLKAMARQPEDRYAGADALHDDLSRWLAGQPIRARPESEWYRLGRFVARHKGVAGTAAAAVVALVVGLSAALWQARVARDEAAKARAMLAFVTEILEKNTRHQTGAAQARTRTVREVLVEASDRAPEAFRGQPALRAELSLTMARLLLDVDEFERADRHFRVAADAAQEAGLAGGDLQVEALGGVATVSRLLGRATEGLAARDRALAFLDARGEGDTLLRAKISASSIAQLATDARRELALASRSVAIFAQRFPAHPDRPAAVLVLAHLHRVDGDWATARTHFLEALALHESLGSRDEASRAAARTWAAFCAAKLGKVREGLAEFEAGLRALEAAAGAQSLLARFHRGHYADLLHQAGRHGQAHAVFDALARTAVPGSPTVVDFDNAVYRADAWLREGRPREAERVLLAFDATHVEFGKRFYPNGVRWATLLALAQARQGHTAQARRSLARVAELPRQFASPPEGLVSYRVDVARLHLALGEAARAAEILGPVPPPGDEGYFPGYVALSLVAGEIALARGDRGAAAALGEAVLGHLHTRTAPGAFPDLEAQAKGLQAAAPAPNGRIGARAT